jgi:hypothetical protein
MERSCSLFSVSRSSGGWVDSSCSFFSASNSEGCSLMGEGRVIEDAILLQGVSDARGKYIDRFKRNQPNNGSPFMS